MAQGKELLVQLTDSFPQFFIKSYCNTLNNLVLTSVKKIILTVKKYQP